MSALMALTLGCTMSSLPFLKPVAGIFNPQKAPDSSTPVAVADNSPEPPPGAVQAAPDTLPGTQDQIASADDPAVPEAAPDVALELAAEIDAETGAAAPLPEGIVAALEPSPDAAISPEMSPETASEAALAPEIETEIEAAALLAAGEPALEARADYLEPASEAIEPALEPAAALAPRAEEYLEPALEPGIAADPEAPVSAESAPGDTGTLIATEFFEEEDLEPVLIDPSLCARGLDGSLATGQVGLGLLAAYGLGERPAFLALPAEGARAASLALDNAPRSTRSLRQNDQITMRILTDAYGQTGRPYRAGGKTPQTGFDPAGLVNWIYAQEGLKIPATAAEQVSKGKAVTRDELRPGDIMVYQTPKSPDYLVGLYTGNGNFILASSQLNVVTETAAFGSDYGPWFVGGRRFVEDPSAAPLSDELKTAAANQAVKVALTAMGDNIPKPANIYGGKKRGSQGKKRIRSKPKKPRTKRG